MGSKHDGAGAAQSSAVGPPPNCLAATPSCHCHHRVGWPAQLQKSVQYSSRNLPIAFPHVFSGEWEGYSSPWGSLSSLAGRLANTDGSHWMDLTLTFTLVRTRFALPLTSFLHPKAVPSSHAWGQCALLNPHLQPPSKPPTCQTLKALNKLPKRNVNRSPGAIRVSVYLEALTFCLQAIFYCLAPRCH